MFRFTKYNDNYDYIWEVAELRECETKAAKSQFCLQGMDLKEIRCCPQRMLYTQSDLFGVSLNLSYTPNEDTSSKQRRQMPKIYTNNIIK